MKRLLRPQVIVPAFLGLALLAALLSFGNVTRVVDLMSSFRRLYLLYFLLLMICYELIRGYEWHFLLRALDVDVPLREQWFALLVGEITKNMPIGNYFQNYVLLRLEHEDIGRTSAATTLMVLNEVAVAVVGVLIIGVGSWTWLRAVIILGLIAAAAFAWVLYHAYLHAEQPEWVKTNKAARRTLEELRNFREGVRDLLHPGVLIPTFLLAASYLLFSGSALYIAMLGLGVHEVAWWDVLAVYLFSLGFSLIFPIPVDIGVAEVSGVGAFLAVGVSRSVAVGTMLVFRALQLGSALTIVGLSLVFLHREMRILITGKRPKRPTP